VGPSETGTSRAHTILCCGCAAALFSLMVPTVFFFSFARLCVHFPSILLPTNCLGCLQPLPRSNQKFMPSPFCCAACEGGGHREPLLLL
jgi:hypothetical protein